MLRRVSPPLDVLALEPWLGGSHAVFLESWAAGSRHRIRIEGLKARHWRWRMRAGAWELARRIKDVPPPDALFVSDYVDLPSLYGFLPPTWADVPALLYFHENQLTYPGQEGEEEPDFHLGFTNILSCLRAEAVVFNSGWHRDNFRDAALELLAKLPKPNPRSALLERLDASGLYPGVVLFAVLAGMFATSFPFTILAVALAPDYTINHRQIAQRLLARLPGTVEIVQALVEV